MILLAGCATGQLKPSTPVTGQVVTTSATPATAPAPRTLPPRYPYSIAFENRAADPKDNMSLIACPRDVTAAEAQFCSARKTWNADYITDRDKLAGLHAPKQ